MVEKGAFLGFLVLVVLFSAVGTFFLNGFGFITGLAVSNDVSLVISVSVIVLLAFVIVLFAVRFIHNHYLRTNQGRDKRFINLELD